MHDFGEDNLPKGLAFPDEKNIWDSDITKDCINCKPKVKRHRSRKDEDDEKAPSVA